jgi:hypothetical protein
MSICPNTGHACRCQPQEDVMCPYGPTPNDWQSATPPAPHYYTFKKPDGWINLANPGQSWDEWTKTQGVPTTQGWKVFGTRPAPSTVEVDERYEFERHMSNRGEAVNYIGDGLYSSGFVQDQWDAWCARAALAAKPAG